MECGGRWEWSGGGGGGGRWRDCWQSSRWKGRKHSTTVVVASLALSGSSWGLAWPGQQAGTIVAWMYHAHQHCCAIAALPPSPPLPVLHNTQQPTCYLSTASDPSTPPVRCCAICSLYHCPLANTASRALSIHLSPCQRRCCCTPFFFSLSPATLSLRLSPTMVSLIPLHSTCKHPHASIDTWKLASIVCRCYPESSRAAVTARQVAAASEEGSERGRRIAPTSTHLSLFSPPLGAVTVISSHVRCCRAVEAQSQSFLRPSQLVLPPPHTALASAR